MSHLTSIQRLEYYPAVMLFIAVQIDLGIVILSEVSQKEIEILYGITYMNNLKRNDTD